MITDHAFPSPRITSTWTSTWSTRHQPRTTRTRKTRTLTSRMAASTTSMGVAASVEYCACPLPSVALHSIRTTIGVLSTTSPLGHPHPPHQRNIHKLQWTPRNLPYGWMPSSVWTMARGKGWTAYFQATIPSKVITTTWMVWHCEKMFAPIVLWIIVLMWTTTTTLRTKRIVLNPKETSTRVVIPLRQRATLCALQTVVVTAVVAWWWIQKIGWT